MKQLNNILDLGEYSLFIAQDNTGRAAAYENGAEVASAIGEEEILASFLEAARNSCGEDELYAAIEAAK